MSELTDEFGGRPYYPYAKRWCEDLFKSGSETTASVRSFKGPLIDDIQHVLETTSEMLELIEPDLKPEYLRPRESEDHVAVVVGVGRQEHERERAFELGHLAFEARDLVGHEVAELGVREGGAVLVELLLGGLVAVASNT